MEVKFYDEQNVGKQVVDNYPAALAEGHSHRRQIAKIDEQHGFCLINIDVQNDFVDKTGSLSVPGAIEDTRRLVRWMIDRTQDGTLRHICASLDSHIPMQIFFPGWWMDKSGNFPPPYTAITTQSILKGQWRPRVILNTDTGENYEQKSIDYCETLESQAKKALMIWPYHTMIGSWGHNLVPSVQEAIAYHAGARSCQPTMLSKGIIPTTEHYSIFEPEVKDPKHLQGTLNTQVLDMLRIYPRIYVAGQAKSHCVLESIKSMMRYFAAHPDIIRRFYFLMDCTSSVQHPDIDFDELANKEFEQFARQGANLVTTTDWM